MDRLKFETQSSTFSHFRYKRRVDLERIGDKSDPTIKLFLISFFFLNKTSKVTLGRKKSRETDGEFLKYT